MNWQEKAEFFTCANDELLGIATIPEFPKDIGVVVVTGGPQYRVGSHRQFVLLARVLGAAGYPCLRFDHRGLGDSEGDSHGFEDIGSDIAAAIDLLLVASPGTRRVILWGLCDAASAILLYWEKTRDPRISGMVLLNPWVRTEETLAQAHIQHYYGQRLLQGEFWQKLISGKFNPLTALHGLLRNLRQANKAKEHGVTGYRQGMRDALGRFAGRVLVLLSEDDLVAQEFRQFAGKFLPRGTSADSDQWTCLQIAGADHTFSKIVWQDEVFRATLEFMNGLENE